MKSFEIEDRYLTDVVEYKSWSIHQGKTEVSADELIGMLKGKDRISSTRTIDHPIFSVLREQLNQERYITIERGWWNGDVVKKPFMLNGVKFKKGDRFCCASAMSIHLSIQKKYQQGKLLKHK